MWLLVAAFLCFAIAIPLLCAWVTRLRRVPGVPVFDDSWLIVGNWPALLRNRSRMYDWRLSQVRRSEQQGKECLQRIGPFLSIIELHSPRMLQYMLHTNFDSFEKGDRFRGIFRDFLGGGIFNSDGDQWRSQRKIASHMFSAAKLNNHMLAVFTAHAKTVLDLLEEQRQKQLQQQRTQQESGQQQPPIGSGDSACTIEMQSLFHRYTMDSIMHIGFGIQLDSLKSKGAPPPFVAAFDQIQEAIVFRFLGPMCRWQWQHKLGWFCNAGERQIARSLVVINEFIQSIIEARRADPEALQESGDLLSLFVTKTREQSERNAAASASATSSSAELPPSSSAADSTDDTLSDKDLRDIVLNFMLAGRDTTASLLTFLFYELSIHPQVEARIVEELNRVLGKPRDVSHAAATEGLTHETLKSLIFLEAAILETLRLHPPVPVDSKRSNRPVTFPDGTHLPAGKMCSYSPYVFGRLESIWGADAATFKPQRFLSPEGDSIVQPSPYAFPQFNAGFRLCLGRGMALLEAKVLTASILRAGLRLRARADHDPQYKITIVLRMRNGLPMRVEKRSMESEAAEQEKEEEEWSIE